MICIFKTLTRPCTLCKSCKALPTLCRESCKCVGKLRDAIRDFWAPITHNPLGGYVLCTWLVMFLAIAAFGLSLSQVKCAASTAEESSRNLVEVQVFVSINIGLALVHMVAARYLQWRIVTSITNNQGEEAIDKLSHKEIAHQATHVALYDFGFCLYFFFFFFIALSYNAHGLSNFRDCEGTGPAWGAAAIKILYGIVAANYFVFWHCCQACCSAKEKHAEKRAQKAEADKIGMGA